MDKKNRQKFFRLKELRLSVALMVLWSLLIVAFFTYTTIELGEVIEHNPLYLLLVFLGYMIIVVILTVIFSHRFLGPFERLKTELKIIMGDNYQRRLCIRNKDDLYIRSFLVEVNKLIDMLEKKYDSEKNVCREIASELSNINSLMDRQEISKEELKDAVISLHKKIVH